MTLQHGLLPTYRAERIALLFRSMCATYRGFEGWWRRSRSGFRSDFVEWVEEQRSKAA